ncbi:DUF1707 domain-containing protein [Amycolatopsis rhabdoformis]|uniref:DUF1707 domain-containing protein n=1 Tax=Amycolatopsis rhabdoformis TaxID=1448059 RepID=A0ABZ1I5W5_9PSEU|nr:DUF1707 domain-containing protein [Amycolatopsis rhabdoformis]WSE29361.1 DUF1707 domain-containing protein [Amycolatopsis rhabdoformis]
MTEVPSPQLRISDQERESALNALGEHMSAGRIDIDEYGERSARITAAKTRGELAELFADLPAPHPVYGNAQPVPAPAAAPVPAPAPQTAVARPNGWNGGQRAVAALVPLVWIATIALIATTTLPAWPLIIAPIALSIIGRAVWGHGWDQNNRDGRYDHRDRHREHRIDHREARREMRNEMRDEFRRRRDRW